MSLLWAGALHKAYPEQVAHYRPSGLGSCGRKQAAGVEGVPQSDPDWKSIWQMELGRAGQDIALKALPYLGFEIEESILVEGEVNGEADYELRAKANNVFSWPVDEVVIGDVKMRNTYAYNHVWMGEDLLTENPEIATQINYYAGTRGRKKIMILLLPYDSASVRNDQRFSKGRAKECNPYVRVFTCDFNPELYVNTLERLAILQTHGVDVNPEYDPTQGKFPCAWANGSCGWYQWCLSKGPGGKISLPAVPASGMILKEWELA
jgi:hypothetical protein